MTVNVIRRVAVASVLAIAAAIAFGPTQAQATRIAVASFGEHPALTAVVAGVKKGLAVEVFVEGRTVTCDTSHMTFDASLAPQMLAKL